MSDIEAKDWCDYEICEGVVIQIDKEDLERIKTRTWYVSKTQKYVRIISSTYCPEDRHVRTITLARFILQRQDKTYAFFADPSRPLDYRKSNLIAYSFKELRRASPKRRAQSTSRYRGVSRTKKGKWRAAIDVDGKSYNLGEWPTEESAALAYNEASRNHFGPVGYQNKIPSKKDSKS
jgi:hypothetical protein